MIRILLIGEYPHPVEQSTLDALAESVRKHAQGYGVQHAAIRVEVDGVKLFEDVA